MSDYIALARQWRPRTFDELLGQDLIKQALTQALTQQRVHHAYLFTGTRGIGKTSVARLVAKALNCVQGVSATPCLICEACLSVDAGRCVDLIEVDGASKTKVEDMRALLEHVQYAPVSGCFKIFLIDEVHMLSTHSFNALLKTLEEPPAHVKFLLATTEPQKIPATILSRCVQFHLKPLDEPVIQSHLAGILKQVDLDAEEAALSLVAQVAKGSMRDALSILEQVIACAQGMITVSLVRSILGFTQHFYAVPILQALSERDGGCLMTLTHQISQEGGHYLHVIETLLQVVHQLAWLQQLPEQSAWRASQADLLPLVQAFSPEGLQLFYQMLLKGQADFMVAPSPRMGFEMLLLRLLAFQPCEEQSMRSPVLAVSSAEPSPEPEPTPDPESKPDPTLLSQSHLTTWREWLTQLHLSGLALHAAEQAEIASFENHVLTLYALVSNRPLWTTNIKKQIESALTKQQGHCIQLKLLWKDTVTDSPAQQKKCEQEKIQQEALAVLAQDDTFRALQQQFDATQIPIKIETV